MNVVRSLYDFIDRYRFHRYMHLFDFVALACSSAYYLLLGLTYILPHIDKNFYIARMALFVLPILYGIKSGIGALTNLTVEYAHKISLTLYNTFIIVGLALTKGEVPDPGWLALYKYSMLCILLPFSVANWYLAFVQNSNHLTAKYITALTGVVNSLLFATVDIQIIMKLFMPKNSEPKDNQIYSDAKKYGPAVLAFLLVLGFGSQAIISLHSYDKGINAFAPIYPY